MREETLVTLFQDQVERSGENCAFRTKREGTWHPTSWREWDRRARSLATELLRVGVEPGDRVAIFGNTREEWVTADTAAMILGAAIVPIYPTLVGSDVAYILENSGAKVLFVEDIDSLSKLRAAGFPIEKLARIVLFDGPNTRVHYTPTASFPPPPPAPVLPSNAVLYEELLAASPGEALLRGVAERMLSVKPSGLSTIMYTSGTTGPPKGVMLTHANFVFETETITRVIDIRRDDEQLLLLPLAHIFGKILVAMQMRVGFTTSFAESLIKAMENAVEVNPTFMGCVPRLYEKIHSVATSRALEQGPVKKSIFDWAGVVGRKVARLRADKQPIDPFLTVQHHYATKLVLSKVRRGFGTRLRLAISGGAPLSPELAQWFFGAGVPIYEAYGLTEVTGGSNLATPEAYRFGTVGRALPDVTVKVAEDGEILIKGANLMRGYWNNEAATAEVIDKDGYFHSGDIGRISHDGFLQITDRKKDIIVTAGGKNIAPQNIENLLKQCSWVSQALVYGDKKPYLVALVSLRPEALVRYTAETGRTLDLAAASSDSDIRSRVQAEITALNERLSRFETIKKFAVLAEDPSIQGGDLTPTLKLKRKVLTERHRALLEGLYG